MDGDDGVIDEGVGVDVDDGSKAEDDGGGVDSLDAVIRSDRTVSHYAFFKSMPTLSTGNRQDAM